MIVISLTINWWYYLMVEVEMVIRLQFRHCGANDCRQELKGTSFVLHSNYVRNLLFFRSFDCKFREVYCNEIISFWRHDGKKKRRKLCADRQTKNKIRFRWRTDLVKSSPSSLSILPLERLSMASKFSSAMTL